MPMLDTYTVDNQQWHDLCTGERHLARQALDIRLLVSTSCACKAVEVQALDKMRSTKTTVCFMLYFEHGAVS